MKTVLLAALMLAAPASAQWTTTTCTVGGQTVRCNTLDMAPQQPVQRQSGTDWSAMLQTTPADIATAFQEGVRRGNCQRAAAAGDQLGVQAFCR